MNDFIDKVTHISALKGLRLLPSHSIDSCICSPPYWGLRSYHGVPTEVWGGDEHCHHQWSSYIRKGTTGGTRTAMLKKKGEANFQIVPDTEQASCEVCGAWRGCLGLEPEPEGYIENLCQIFDEVLRVLKSSGTFFLNIGDTYLGSGKGVWKGREKANKESFQFKEKPLQLMGGWKKPKQLGMIPFRVAIEMQNRGWLLRNNIIWQKGNALPSSVTDRFSVDFESVFFFTKSANYYFQQQLEPFSKQSKPDEIYTGQTTKDYEAEGAQNPSDTKRRILESMRRRGGRNKRTVWKINTKPCKYKHTATYPQELVEIMVKAGCPIGGLILDPFMGMFTTAIVARKLSRHFTGFELSADYIKIGTERFDEETALLV